jgi:spore maturation protein SpmB
MREALLMNKTGKGKAYALTALALVTALLAFFQPDACQNAALEALVLCGRQLLPALFPFLVVSALIVSTGTASALGFFLRPAARLLGQPKSASGVLLIGLVGGFAPAAAAVAGLYRRGELDAQQAARLLPAAICSGPSFVILACGSGMLGSEMLGLLIFISQIAACFVCGIVQRLCSRPKKSLSDGMPAARPNPQDAAPAQPEPPSLYRAISDSVLIFLRLCGFVIYFRFLAGGLSAFLPARLACIPTMVCEVSSGCAAASQLGENAAYWCCAVLSLQSFSVLMQVRSILPAEISVRPLLAMRAVHLPLSLLGLRLMLAFLPAQAVYNSLAPRVIALPRCPLDTAFWMFCGCCCLAVQLCRTLQQRQNSV